MVLTTRPTATPLAARPPGLRRSQTRAEIRRSAWRALHHPNFALYFGGSLVSNLGTWLQNTAQILLAYQLTRSVFAVGVVTCVQFAGPLVLGPYATVLASQVGGKRMLIGTQLFSAAVAGGLAILQAAGFLGEPLLILGALGLGLAFTFALPVQTALVPKLVSEADTEAALAMNSVSYNAGRMLAPALCVLVIIDLGFVWAFALNAISFVIFAAMLAKAHPRADARPSERARVMDGARLALGQPRIALLLVMVATVTFADDPILVLGPALARNAGAPNGWAGYFLSALGCGTILGSLLPTKTPIRKPRTSTSRRAAVSLLVLAFAVIVFSAGISTWVSLLAALVAGMAGLLTGATTQALLVQQRREQAASIMALWAIAWAGTKPIASLTDGWLASTVGVLPAGIVLTIPALALGLTVIFLPEKQKKRIRRRGGQICARLLEFPGRVTEASRGGPRTPRAAPDPSAIGVPVAASYTYSDNSEKSGLFGRKFLDLHPADYRQLPARLGSDSYLESSVDPAERPLTSVPAVGA